MRCAGRLLGLDRFGDESKNTLENAEHPDARVRTQVAEKNPDLPRLGDFVDTAPFEWRFQREKDLDDARYNTRFIHHYALPLL